MAEITTQQKTETKVSKPVRLLIKGDDQAIKSQIDAIAVLDGESIRISGRYKSLDMKHAFKEDYDLSGWVRFNLELYNDGHVRFMLHPPSMEMVATASTTINGAPAAIFTSKDPERQVATVLYDVLYQISQGHDQKNTPVSSTAELEHRYGSGEFIIYESEPSSQHSTDMARTGAATLADAIKNSIARKPNKGLVEFLRSHRSFGY